MDPARRSHLPFRLLAFLLITAGAAWLAYRSDFRELARIDSMSAADYVAHQRHQHQSSYGPLLGGMLLIGALYLGAIELTALLLRFLVRRPDSPDWGPTLKS
jgi:hypothetical protein